MSLELTLTALAAYLVGSVPTGVLLARLKNVDVRRAGSGNIGATNVARTAGAKLGLLTLLLDAVKGALPVVLARRLVPQAESNPALAGGLAVTGALGAVAGHVFSIFLSFRGGKGVATAFGSLLALAPGVTLLPLAAFALVFGVARRVSLASIVAAATAPIGAALAGYGQGVTLVVAAIAGLVILRHRENITRLLAGTEPRFGRSP